MQKGFVPIIVVIAFIVAVGLGVGGYYLYNWQRVKSINSFEECAKYYQVMESYPEQCNTPNGKHFVRDLTDEEKQRLVPPQEVLQKDDETGNWKIYTNTEYGFSLKYPLNLSELGNGVQMFLVKDNATQAEKLSYADQLVEIRVNKNVDRFNKYYNTTDNKKVAGFEDFKIRSGVISNYKMVEYGYDEEEKQGQMNANEEAIKSGASVGMIYFNRGLIVDKEGMIIELSTNSYYGDFKKIFDQILSTLKFLK